MMNSLWIAKTGMSAQQTKMDVVSHNLSNVSTTGYKRQNAVFEDLIYQNLRQVGAPADEQNNLPTGMHLGLGVRTVATTRNFQQGTPTETGKDLDVAISGDGFFQIQMPDGTTAYTRDGTFSKDANGQLVTSGGYPLLDGITVPRLLVPGVPVWGAPEAALSRYRFSPMGSRPAGLMNDAVLS